MSISKKQVTLIAAVCITASSVTYYFTGHQYNESLKTWLCIIFFGAWLLLYANLLLDLTPKAQKEYEQRSSGAHMRRIFYTIGFCGFIMANILLVNYLAERRVEHFLSEEAVTEANATVARFEERHTKYHAKHYVIIQYQAEDGLMEQALYDYAHQYSVGQKIAIKYSNEHPSMLEVLLPVNK